MKAACAILLLILAVVASGCTAPATPPAVSANDTIPNLTGIWSQTATGHVQAEGFVDNRLGAWNISAQKGQAFCGRKEYSRDDGMIHYENFSGFVTTKGEIYESDDTAGIAIGSITGPNSMELNYVEDGPETRAFIIHLTRQKI